MVKASLYVTILGLTICSFAFGVNGTLPGGGTAADPYLIQDFNDFQAFADSNNSSIYWVADVYTELTCDLDLDPSLAGREIYPDALIASTASGAQYQGIFDGKNHVIINLEIDTSTSGNEYQIALFGVLDGNKAMIKNLGIIDGIVTVPTTGNSAALLCGRNQYAKIENCYATGTVSGGSNVGGLCGIVATNIYNTANPDPATTRYCYADVSISGNSSLGGLIGTSSYSETAYCYATGKVDGGYYGADCGGLIGSNNGTVTYCFATGEVIGGDRALGGLCGDNSSGSTVTGKISYCYATGSVYGYYADYLGGLCGVNDYGSISNCYATGSVKNASTSYGYVGGIAGYQKNGGKISYSYATGALINERVSSTHPGGICELAIGGSVATNSYWDKVTTGTTFSDDGGIGKTTAEMMTTTTFAGWNFSSIWEQNNQRDYPKLTWQPFGDLNNDGFVNMIDFTILSSNWNYSLGDVNYKSVCDLHPDNTIDILDLEQLCSMWLEGPSWL